MKHDVVQFKVTENCAIAIFPNGESLKEGITEPVVRIIGNLKDGSQKEVDLKLSTLKEVMKLVDGKLETIELLFKREV